MKKLIGTIALLGLYTFFYLVLELAINDYQGASLKTHGAPSYSTPPKSGPRCPRPVCAASICL